MGEFPRADALASFDLHGLQMQPGALPANNLDRGIAQNYAARLRLDSRNTPRARCAWPSPDVAQPPAKYGKRSRTGREPPNPVINLARGLPPIDAPMLFGEDRSIARPR